MDEAEQAGVKQSSHNLQEGCCIKKLKVPEPVAETFGPAEKLLQGANGTDI